MPALILNEEAVKRCLPMKECIEHTAKALRLVCSPQLLNPVRHGVILPLEGKEGMHVIGFMPCYLADSIVGSGEWWNPTPPQPEEKGGGFRSGFLRMFQSQSDDVPEPKRRKGCGGYICCKVITVFPSNVGTGFNGHQGVVLLSSAENGSLLSISDAHEITGTRTAAASAVATRLLAKEGPCVLALLGTGFEAIKHLEAICAVRDVTDVHVWSRTKSRAEAFAASAGMRVTVHDTAQLAVQDADIVCTLTPAQSPILKYSWLKPGAHVNAVGSCNPKQQELDEECIKHGVVFCDTKEGCLEGVTRTGDIVIPIENGNFNPENLTEIGSILDKGWARKSPEDITVYKSVGVAVEDLVSAVALYEKAKAEPEGSIPRM